MKNTRCERLWEEPGRCERYPTALGLWRGEVAPLIMLSLCLGEVHGRPSRWASRGASKVYRFLLIYQSHGDICVAEVPADAPVIASVILPD